MEGGVRPKRKEKKSGGTFNDSNQTRIELSVLVCFFLTLHLAGIDPVKCM